MPSPSPYHDDDRPPRGSPRLYGELTGLSGVPTSAMRHRKPSEWSRRIMHRKIIIAACYEARIPSRIVADFLEVDISTVQKLYRKVACVDLRKSM